MARFILLLVLFVVIARTFWRFVDGMVRGVSGPAAGGRRPGTPAAEASQVLEQVKDERLAELQSLLLSQQAAFNAGCIGRTLPVLFERRGRYSGQLIGRTPYNQGIHAAASPDCVGQVHDVRLLRADRQSLAGALVLSAATLDKSGVAA